MNLRTNNKDTLIKIAWEGYNDKEINRKESKDAKAMKLRKNSLARNVVKIRHLIVRQLHILKFYLSVYLCPLFLTL